MSRIPFDPKRLEPFREFLETVPEPSEMSREQLEEYEEKLDSVIDELNQLEPKPGDSENYDLWADLHEELEDALDDIRDSLD